MGEVALAMASRPHAEPTHKVKLNRSTANGRWGIEIEVASRDLDEAYAAAVEKARALAQEFPYIETPPGVGPTTKAKKKAEPSNEVPF